MQQISSRLCEQWDALKAYFNSEPIDWVYSEDGKRKKVDKLQRENVQKVRKMLDDDVLGLSYMFLRDILLMFTRFNQFFSNCRV